MAKTQLSTDNLNIVYIPAVITDSPPLTIDEYLQCSEEEKNTILNSCDIILGFQKRLTTPWRKQILFVWICNLKV